MIVPGSSIAPRSRGSSVWTPAAVECAVATRRLARAATAAGAAPTPGHGLLLRSSCSVVVRLPASASRRSAGSGVLSARLRAPLVDGLVEAVAGPADVRARDRPLGRSRRATTSPVGVRTMRMSSRFGRTVRQATQVRFGTRRGATVLAARATTPPPRMGRRRPSWRRFALARRLLARSRPSWRPASRPRRRPSSRASAGGLGLVGWRGSASAPARPSARSAPSPSWRASASRLRSPRRRLRPRRRASASPSAASAASAATAASVAASASRRRGLERRPRRPRPAARRGRGVGGGLRLGHRDVAPDVDPPAGQAGGEPGVLALAADRQREHPLGDGHARDPVLLVDVDRDDLGRAQGVGHEDAGVVAPRDDVDLLAGQLGDDGLDARAALADGRPDRVEAVLARRDGDLGAAAGLAGDRLDLDRAVVDLRDLELEQALEEALVGAADEDLRALGRATDLEHERLDVLADAVVLERATARSWRGSPRRSCRRRG